MGACPERVFCLFQLPQLPPLLIFEDAQEFWVSREELFLGQLEDEARLSVAANFDVSARATAGVLLVDNACSRAFAV